MSQYGELLFSAYWSLYETPPGGYLSLIHIFPYGGLFQLGGGQLAQGFFLVPEAGIFTLDMPGLILQTVSYTHLDVYKRQL